MNKRQRKKHSIQSKMVCSSAGYRAFVLRMSRYLRRRLRKGKIKFKPVTFEVAYSEPWVGT